MTMSLAFVSGVLSPLSAQQTRARPAAWRKAPVAPTISRQRRSFYAPTPYGCRCPEGLMPGLEPVRSCEKEFATGAIENPRKREFTN
jgi:hypothetical protein